MNKYYAAKVTTGQELKVKQIFDKYLKKQLFKQEVEIVVMQKNIRKKSKKSFINVKEVVIKGYVIIACQNLNNELYYKLKSIYGIKKILFDNIPVEEFKNILKKLKNSYYKRLELAKKIMQEKSLRNLSFRNLFRKAKVTWVEIKGEEVRGVARKILFLRI